jgi:Arc/MetJ-type ribon-helix-helix transcriptional regulator
MEVHLTPDQKAFVRQAIESGRLHREEDAVQEALSLWEERERSRAEILTAVDVAEASIARGEGRNYAGIHAANGRRCEEARSQPPCR